MGKLISEGKIRGWRQSQAAAEQIRRPHAVTPLTAVQSEYSMMERMFEREVIPLCKELRVGFVPFHRFRLEVSSSNFPRCVRNCTQAGRARAKLPINIDPQSIASSMTQRIRLVLPIIER